MTKNELPSSAEKQIQRNEENLNVEETGESKDVKSRPDRNCFQRWLRKCRNGAGEFYEKRKKTFKLVYYALLLLLYHAYFVAAIVISGWKTTALIVVTILAWIVALYYYVYVPYLKPAVAKMAKLDCCRIILAVKSGFNQKYVKLAFYVAIPLAIAIFIGFNTATNPSRLVSLAGMVVFLTIGVVFSKDSTQINWRPVLMGLLVQFCLSLLVFRWHYGLEAFAWIAEMMVTFLKHTYAGTAFVYGFISTPPDICGLSPVLLFTVFQVIIFFGATVNVLYYYGVMQWAVRAAASFMHCVLGTTAAESVCTVASTILGMSEAPLIIRPYMPKMTDSELHQIMTSGYASIAGSLFAAYVAFGACTSYLLASSLMSAPMSICISKLLYPETETSQTKEMKDLVLAKSEERNVIEAISNGAYAVVGIVAIIGANLVVFIAVVAFLNALVGWLGGLVGVHDITLELIYSYLFFPLAFLMGSSDASDWDTRVADTMAVAELIGTKTILNEFIAYRKMAQMITEGRLSKHPQMIATYALCGFSNFASIGIQIGALIGLCPEKRDVLPSLAVRALVAGSLSNFMIACFAGLLAPYPEACLPETATSNCTDLGAFRRFSGNESIAV